MDQNYQQFQKLTHHKLLLFLPILCQYVGLGIPQLYVETIWAWKSSMLKNYAEEWLFKGQKQLLTI